MDTGERWKLTELYGTLFAVKVRELFLTKFNLYRSSNINLMEYRLQTTQDLCLT